MTIKVQPIKRHGGKGGSNGMAAWIRSLAPPSVVEDKKHGYTHRNHAFAGGLGELWNWKCEGISEAVNDLDYFLIKFFDICAL